MSIYAIAWTLWQLYRGEGSLYTRSIIKPQYFHLEIFFTGQWQVKIAQPRLQNTNEGAVSPNTQQKKSKVKGGFTLPTVCWDSRPISKTSPTSFYCVHICSIILNYLQVSSNFIRIEVSSYGIQTFWRSIFYLLSIELSVNLVLLPSSTIIYSFNLK